ncbi:MAG TPA: hypothetical protein VH914_17830 [Acidimicrobiia bacterium]|nr:hypothetical protein [Acidimicrobiia bacterium]
MKRLVIVIAVALMTPLMLVSAASAHTLQASASCTGATFTFLRFKDGVSHTVNETVSIDGAQVAAQPFTFDGRTGTNTVAITVPIGTHTVGTHADWQTHTGTRAIDRHRLVSGCGTALCPTSSISADFNEIAIPDHRTIWFNSSFRVIGGDASPVTFSTHGGQVTFSDNGTDYVVPIPDATITFSPATAQASVTFKGKHWSTDVPAGFGDNVFLSGAAFSVPAGGLSGSISPVTWTTQILSDNPNVTIEWQWAAAVFGGLSGYNHMGVKPLHSATLDKYPNGDEAGTPETNANFSTGGARGYGDGDGHGSNTASATCALTS